MTLAQACSVLLHVMARPHLGSDPTVHHARHIATSALLSLYHPATLATPRALFAALNRGTPLRQTTVSSIYGQLTCILWNTPTNSTLVYPVLPAYLIPDEYLSLYVRQVPSILHQLQ